MRYRPSRRSHRQQSSNGRRPRNVLPPPERHAIARFDHFAGRRTTADDISPTRRYRRRRQSRQKRRPSVGPTGPIGPSAPFAPSEPGAPFARFRAGRRRSAGELAPGRPRPRPPVGRRASTAETTTHLLAVRKRLCDVGSRRKLTQTTTTIATMRRYFPCSRRLIIIFSHQEDAPTGPGRRGRRLGRGSPIGSHAQLGRRRTARLACRRATGTCWLASALLAQHRPPRLHPRYGVPQRL